MKLLLESALAYAERGLPVFPIKPKGKAPLTAHGFKDATTDPKKIRSWWQNNPEAGIGIATGSASNLIVVDIDIDKEREINGWEALQKLVARYGEITTSTWTAKTGRGGTHYYFRLRPGQSFKSSSGKLGIGLDVKAEGGYIIAPPSIHPNGESYAWVVSQEETEVAEIPPALIQALQAQEPVKTKQENGTIFVAGERNDSMFTLAVHAHKNGASTAAIKAMMLEQNKSCSPPLEDKELESILKSATGYSVKDSVKSSLIVPKLHSLEETTEGDPEWLIKGYIPKNAMTTMAGDGGSGKTSVWCHIAGAISAGKISILDDPIRFFEEERKPATVLYFSSEDSTEFTLKKRLRLNGARMDMIKYLPYSSEYFQYIKFSDVALERIVADHRPKLVIFDPLQGFLSHDTNMASRNHMRTEMGHIARLCSVYDTTALIIMHTNKSAQTYGRGRMADSADIWDYARSCLIVGTDPNTGYRYLSQEKTNYGMLQKTILFEIEDGGKVTYKGATSKRDKDFQSEKSFANRTAPARLEAEQAIVEYLQENGSPQFVSELDEYLKTIGISANAIKTAKSSLRREGKIELEKPNERGGKWSISLTINI